MGSDNRCSQSRPRCYQPGGFDRCAMRWPPQALTGLNALADILVTRYRAPGADLRTTKVPPASSGRHCGKQ